MDCGRSRDPRRARALALLAAAALVAACSGAGEAPVRPNLLLISVDTLRADHLSAYGYERETSPNVDRLAADGILFENAYSHSPKTAISHMSILTGLRPEAHGVVQNGFPDTRRLSEQIPTLATLLGRAGYRCGAVTAGGNVAPELGFDQGMETFDLIDPPRLAFARALARMEELSAPRGDDRAAPFFLFLHTFEVHSPYAPSADHAALYADPSYTGRIPASREALDARAGTDWEKRHEIFFEGVDRTDTADVQRLKDLYDGSIRETDALLGGLLAAAEERGLLDDTIVVLLSDHGEEFMEHGRLLHSQLYRELLHVPLIVSLPKSRDERFAGVRVDALARMIDIAPTLLEWLDVGVPQHLQGRSLVEVVAGAAAAEPLIASSHRRERARALRLGVWKLIEQTDRRGATTYELYDTTRDPDERNDVAGDKPSVVALLASRLERLDVESLAFLEERSRGRRVTLREETRARLEALGYVGEEERGRGPVSR